MASIKKIDEVIALREMKFHYEDGRVEKASLKIGKPYPYNEENDFVCLYELSTESKSKLSEMVGIDSLQALDLTMKSLSVEVEYWERSQKGKFFYLDEEGAEV